MDSVLKPINSGVGFSYSNIEKVLDFPFNIFVKLLEYTIVTCTLWCWYGNC